MAEAVAQVERIGSALKEIQRRGKIAASGRQFEIVAVSKLMSQNLMADAYRAGVRDFGENYADELIEKATSSTLIFSEDPIRWHYIGGIQAKMIVKLAPYVAVWHSVAREKELKRIVQLSPEAKIFIQISCGDALGRNGVPLAEAAELVGLGRMLGLDVLGLMVVPPRAHSTATEKIFKEVNEERLRLDLQFLSMGMSNDYELALAQGSTHIRIGEALFGGRDVGGNVTDQGQGGRG